MTISVNFTRNNAGVIVGSSLDTGNMPYEQVLVECEKYIKEQYDLRERIKFVIGDLLNSLHARYQHGAWEQVIPDVKVLFDGEQGIATLINWAAVCDRIPVHIRTGLSFTHHATVAYVDSRNCQQFMIYEPEYIAYCNEHELVDMHPCTLQSFLLGKGENMTSRELHNYKMHILAGKPIVEATTKNTPTQVLRGVQSILGDLLTYSTNEKIKAEIRLNEVNKVLQSILAQESTNVIQLERKAQ